jgi:hypothetical protein
MAPDEVKDKAKKRLFRAGIISTTPTGLGGYETLATTRLK